MRNKFTEIHKNFVINNIAGKRYRELVNQFNNHFGIEVTEDTMRSLARSLKINSGLVKKGSSWNAGIKYNKHRLKPIGSETIDKNGYTLIKVSNPRNWKCKHTIIWENVYGKVPENHVIIFLDKNKNNFDIHNLALVSRAELMYMNRKELIFNDADLTKAGQLIASVKMEIYNRKSKRRRTNNEKT
jgi:hypothetical protein